MLGDGDSGFAFPNKEDINGTRAPPGQYINTSVPTSQPQTSSQSSEHETQFRHADQEILHMEKSLQSLVAEMTADAVSFNASFLFFNLVSCSVWCISYSCYVSQNNELF